MVKMVPCEVGNIIRFHREKCGLMRKQLTELADVGKFVVSDMEKGGNTGSGIIAYSDRNLPVIPE